MKWNLSEQARAEIRRYRTSNKLQRPHVQTALFNTSVEDGNPFDTKPDISTPNQEIEPREQFTQYFHPNDPLGLNMSLRIIGVVNPDDVRFDDFGRPVEITGSLSPKQIKQIRFR